LAEAGIQQASGLVHIIELHRPQPRSHAPWWRHPWTHSHMPERREIEEACPSRGRGVGSFGSGATNSRNPHTLFRVG